MRDPFPYDRSAVERDRIAGTEHPGRYSFGVAHFHDLDVASLAVLLDRRFIDPHDRQNGSPTVWQIFRFMCAHPTVLAAGYVVSADRPDYRTSIEAIGSPTIDDSLKAAALAFCTETDGLELDTSLECFWD